MLTQNCANYKREEILESKMTYPLPPFSTVIGAIHSACKYKEYHPMKIGIQGSFGSIYKKAYINHCYLKDCDNTRGHLAISKNPTLLSGNVKIVASSLSKQDNDFYKGITIKVEDEESLAYYRYLKDFKRDFPKRKKEEMKPYEEASKNLDEKIKSEPCKEEKKQLRQEKGSIKTQKDKKIEDLQKLYQEEFEDEYEHFKTLVTGVKHYEILSDVYLILHIHSDEKTMNDIYENAYNIRSLGRAEDFVYIEDVKFVELNNAFDVDDENLEYRNDLQVYIDYPLIRDGIIKSRFAEGVHKCGTRYFLNKDYQIINNKRVFNKKHVIYMSNYVVDGNAENLYLSSDNYLVNLI